MSQSLPEPAERGAETMCARHPRTPTRLHCSDCGTPICPRCSVDTVVGQKCPTCARPEKGARRQGKPDQYVKAILFGVGAAVVIGIVLYAFFRSVGFLPLIGSAFAGYGVARAVDLGASRNKARPFMAISVALSVLMVLGVWVIGYGILAPQSLRALTYVAAPYGAWILYRR
jgi:hypothetical protein